MSVRFIASSAVSCMLFVAGAVQAAPDTAKVKEILGANACLACHGIDKKIVGPSYQDIGAKYKGGDATVAETLTKHIKQGSSGVWGPIPMPPNPNVSNDNVALIVDWIIAGAPQ